MMLLPLIITIKCIVRKTPQRFPRFIHWRRPQLPFTNMSGSIYYFSTHVEEQASDARKIFQASVEAVLPGKMVTASLIRNGDQLSAGGKVYKLNKNLYIAAFGKAVAGMVSAAEKCLADHVVDGVASVPVGLQEALQNAGKSHMWPSQSSKVEILEGAANNIPDESSAVAAQKIKQLAINLSEEDILLVLVSGGGSALLPATIPPITLEQKQAITKLLTSRGASIQELNIVRSAISSVKGGKLALLAKPAKVISLILSDIVGDPIELIASGPTVPSHATPHDCIQILHKYTKPGEVPNVIYNVILQPGDQTCKYDHVNNIIVGNNVIAVSAGLKAAEEVGYVTFVLSKSVCGDAREVGRQYAELAEVMCKIMKTPNYNSDLTAKLSSLLKSFHLPERTLESVVESAKQKRAICLIGAGETTVTLRGKGKGGRNQEMALAWAVTMETCLVTDFHITFLCGGTDGQDGPTDAAGACVHPSLVSDASKVNLSAKDALEQNDSYTFFSQWMNGNNLLKIGLTGTNVMDIQILLIRPP